MTDTVLGIQVGEHRILPILDLASPARATRYFTTLKDNQPKALFHFFLRDIKAATRWLSVGWVFLEGLSPAPGGQPTLELTLDPESSGDVLLELRDRSSGIRKRLRFPASQLGVGIPRGSGSVSTDRKPPAEKPALRDPGERSPQHPGVQLKGRRRQRKILLAVIVAVSTALLVFVFLLLTTTLTMSPVAQSLLRRGEVLQRQEAALRSAQQDSGYSLEEVKQTSPGAVPSDRQNGGRSADVEDTQPSRDDGLRSEGTGNVAEAVPSVRAQNAGAIEEQDGVGQGGDFLPYRIHWGDTLWQITERYYGDPSLYHLLAVENGISNPHSIISGMEIRLPSKIDDKKRKESQ